MFFPIAEKTRKETLIAQRNALIDLMRQEDARERKALRKADNNRKLLVGVAILQKASLDVKYENWLVHSLLDGFLTRNEERRLFGLSPREKDAVPAPAPRGKANQHSRLRKDEQA